MRQLWNYDWQTNQSTQKTTAHMDYPGTEPEPVQ